MKYSSFVSVRGRPRLFLGIFIAGASETTDEISTDSNSSEKLSMNFSFSFCFTIYFKVLLFGDFGAFSLHPLKNINVWSDGGIITTNNKRYYLIMRKLRNLGSEKKFEHDLVGMNSRLDSIQAIILYHKIKKLQI